jgi:hypothetical protein
VRPDLVIRGWVEVDGKPHEKFSRVLNFRRAESSSVSQIGTEAVSAVSTQVAAVQP